mmetsp:Transcript_62008/g.183142  ORF Transcript_62008/g.183142 Transcript_62008/m.183142 type:complete len:231 (+) Transcript_62008:990-1682(+)
MTIVPAHTLILLRIVPLLPMMLLDFVQYTVQILQGRIPTRYPVPPLGVRLKIGVEESMKMDAYALHPRALSAVVRRITSGQFEIFTGQLDPSGTDPLARDGGGARFGKEGGVFEYAFGGHDAVASGVSEAFAGVVEGFNPPVGDDGNSIPHTLHGPPYGAPIRLPRESTLLKPIASVDRQHGRSGVDQPFVQIQAVLDPRREEPDLDAEGNVQVARQMPDQFNQMILFFQ